MQHGKPTKFLADRGAQVVVCASLELQPHGLGTNGRNNPKLLMQPYFWPRGRTRGIQQLLPASQWQEPNCA